MSGAALPEVSERDATGRVAELYEEIRSTVGLPLVNLVYRVLAATDRLDAAWAQLGPNLRDPGIESAAAALVGEVRASSPAIPSAALATVGLHGDRLAGARSTVGAYMHANPRNLLAVTALLEEAAGTGSKEPDAGSMPPPADWVILPMASLDALDETASALIGEMSAPLVSPGEGALVPSLLRHFADEPVQLAMLWTSIAPSVESGAVAEEAERVSKRAIELAASFPYAVAPLEDELTRETLVPFRFTLSRMIVVGALLEQALGVRRPGQETA
jgi:hypothetical protein